MFEEHLLDQVGGAVGQVVSQLVGRLVGWFVVLVRVSAFVASVMPVCELRVGRD